MVSCRGEVLEQCWRSRFERGTHSEACVSVQGYDEGKTALILRVIASMGFKESLGRKHADAGE